MQFRFRSEAAAFGTLVGALLSASIAHATEQVSVTDIPVGVHTLLLNVSSSYRVSGGHFDPYGAYTSYVDGSSVWGLTTLFRTSYRLSQYWEGGLSFSLRNSQMSFPTGKMTSTSVGSPGADMRFHAGGWAHLILHLGMSLPYSVSSRNIVGDPSKSAMTDDLGSTTGFALRTGFGVSRTLRPLPLRLALDATASLPFAQSTVLSDAPSGTPAVMIRKGKQFQTSEGIAYVASPLWILSAGLKQIWAMDTHSNDIDIPGTAGRLFSTSLGLAYSSGPTLRWTASYDTSFPFYSYAVNNSYSPALSLGMSYTTL